MSAVIRVRSLVMPLKVVAHDQTVFLDTSTETLELQPSEARSLATALLTAATSEQGRELRRPASVDEQLRDREV